MNGVRGLWIGAKTRVSIFYLPLLQSVTLNKKLISITVNMSVFGIPSLFLLNLFTKKGKQIFFIKNTDF